MHVLMTADAVGGVWTYALELCRQLDARGADVTLKDTKVGMTPAGWADYAKQFEIRDLLQRLQ